VGTVAHTEFVLYAKLIQVNMKATVVVGQEIVVTTIEHNTQLIVSLFAF
jgi:hypothetical protein